MTSAEYWRKREAAQREKNITDERAYQKELRRIYAETLDRVQKEIDAFYAKYAAKEGITLAEAKRRASKLDMDAYSRKAKKYVRERNFSAQANEEMRLYNLTMKVNRLELLKANIGAELVSGFDEMQKFFDQKLTDRTLDEFQRQAGILGDSVRDNQKLAHTIVNASFHNATYSDRIWAHQDVLKSELGVLLQSGMIQGKGSRELARQLRGKFDVSRSDAERLMTTELRRCQTDAAKQSYIQNGNKEYQFLTTSMKPCPTCEDLDGRVFQVKDMTPGSNAPPMHPRCHCCTAPYWDQAEFDRWLEEENRKMHERENAGETVVKPGLRGIINNIVRGHSGTPKEAEPGSAIDHIGLDNTVDVRTVYNEDGLKGKDIHTTNHGNPKKHPYGKRGEHVHDYDWDEDKRLRNKTTRELTESEREENGDIL